MLMSVQSMLKQANDSTMLVYNRPSIMLVFPSVSSMLMQASQQ